MFFISLFYFQALDLIEIASDSVAVRHYQNENGQFEVVELEINSSNDCRSAAAGDLDNDGDLDLFLGYNGANQVWLNDGFGIFTDSEQELGEELTLTVRLGDLDNDGDLDAVCANWGAPEKIYINNGSGVFQEAAGLTYEYTNSDEQTELIEDSGQTRALDLADLNNDGLLDIALYHTNNGGGLRIWLNTGSNQFERTFLEGNPGMPDAFQLKLADLDGDGDTDLFIAAVENNPDRIYINDGSGIFSDSGQRLGISRTTDAAIGDLDLDGDLDIMAAHSDSDCDGSNTTYLNDGSGTFEANQYFGNDPSYHVTLADLDSDGDLDAAFANRGSDGFPNRIWLNQNGRFFDQGQRFGDERSSQLIAGNFRNRLSKLQGQVWNIHPTQSGKLLFDPKFEEPILVNTFDPNGHKTSKTILGKTHFDLPANTALIEVIGPNAWLEIQSETKRPLQEAQAAWQCSVKGQFWVLISNTQNQVNQIWDNLGQQFQLEPFQTIWFQAEMNPLNLYQVQGLFPLVLRISQSNGKELQPIFGP